VAELGSRAKLPLTEVNLTHADETAEIVFGSTANSCWLTTGNRDGLAQRTIGSEATTTLLSGTA
jgi:hypothetical protein